MALFICSNCGYGSASWLGKCPDCGQWKTFTEQRGMGSDSGKQKETVKKITITPLSKVQTTKKERKSTGIYELDRVLGGGLISGAVILLTGEPGVGKSTLLLQSLHKMRTLYISGEEAPEQVRDRAERLGVSLQHFYFSDDLQVEGIVEGFNEMKDQIDVLVIDSVQTIYSKDIEGQPGSVSQLREASSQIVIAAKKNRIPVIMVGHITKEGDIAGPKTLEHMVDTVLTFEGERISHFRILRATKNRFGSTDEIGIFAMEKEGLAEVNNPTAFLDEDETPANVPGKAVVGITEGKRPLFFEVQTLASPTVLAMPRRVVKGVDYNKVLLLLAVIRKHVNISLDKYDIYVNVVGGVNVKSTAADLGIVAALISSLKNMALPQGALFIGEVGLLGEIRKVFSEDKIVAEAKRMNFKSVYYSKTMKSIKEINRLFIQE